MHNSSTNKQGGDSDTDEPISHQCAGLDELTIQEMSELEDEDDRISHHI